MLVDDNNRFEIAQWVCESGGKADIFRDGRPGLVVDTPLGKLRAYPQDLVVKSDKGAFYVYTPKFKL